MRIIRQSSFKSVPWKNGGGVTHEALRLPAAPDPFCIRVSVARIDVSGPFSDFTGFRRTMVLLRGGGVSLKFAGGDERQLRRMGDIVQFDGAAPTTCDLLDGPCVDFNLMTADALGSVEAAVVRLEAPLRLPAEASRSTLVFPIEGALELAEREHRAVLETWDLGLLERKNVDCELVPRESAALVFVAVVPV